MQLPHAKGTNLTAGEHLDSLPHQSGRVYRIQGAGRYKGYRALACTQESTMWFVQIVTLCLTVKELSNLKCQTDIKRKHTLFFALFVPSNLILTVRSLTFGKPSFVH